MNPVLGDQASTIRKLNLWVQEIQIVLNELQSGVLYYRNCKVKQQLFISYSTLLICTRYHRNRKERRKY